MADIDELELFEGISNRRLARLRQAASILEIEKGGIIYLPGEPSEQVYIVAEGRVKVSRISESGKEFTLSYYDPGELFGEQTLLEGGPRLTMAVALVDSSLWVIPRETFLDLARSSSTFALRLGTIIGRRRHELENRMESLVFRDVPSRLALQLLELAERYGVEKDGAIEIELKLSQLELANMIGATRETTSTALNELKRAGILETSHRKIVICKPLQLKVLGESL